jgi:hypothetical protein
MTLYRLELRQAIYSGNTVRRKWRNTFFAERDSVDDALIVAQAIWSNLRQQTRANVFCYEIYATDLNPGTSDYRVITVPNEEQTGLLSATPDLWDINVCWALSLNVGSSRPSRKYIRPGLAEGDFSGGNFTNFGWLSDYVNMVKLMLELIPPLRDESGNPFSGTASIKLSNRRLGRTSPLNLPPHPGV